jgi:hypothetical protein
MRWTPLIFALTAGLVCAQTESSETPAATPATSPTPEAAEQAPAEAAPSPAPETTGVATDLPVGEVGVLPTLEPAAEGAPLTTEDVIPLIPQTDAALPDEAFTDPNAIIPDEPPPLPPSSVAVESEEEKERELAVRYREVRVKAEKDPQVTSMKEKAEAATSMEDRRAALREYYRLLFKKVVALDKSLKSKAEIMEEAYIRRLAQIRLEPTIPLNPPPTPEPIN